MAYPPHAVDLGLPLTYSTGGNERLKVDVAQTGFFDAREFRFSLDKEAAYVVKVVAPIDFILNQQSLFSHDSVATFKAYTASQVLAEATPFNDALVTINNNAMTSAPSYTGQLTFTGGGTITLNGTPEPREYIKVVTANATAQLATVGGNAVRERGLAAGTYYLVFTGDDYSYRLIFEERP